MGAASYKVKVRQDINGRPLLIVTFDVQYELILNQERFESLHRSVERFAEGIDNEQLTKEEFLLWTDELNRMVNFKNQVSELPPYIFLQLEPKPSPIPSGLLYKILSDYESNTRQPLNIFISGDAPNLSVNFNCGTLTYSVPIPATQAAETARALNQLSAEAQRCVDEGRNRDETIRALRETGGAVINTGKVTKEIVECAVSVAGVVAGPPGISNVVKQCEQAAASVQQLNDIYSRTQAEKEREARERYQEQTVRDLERGFQCADVYGEGIERARDLERGILEGRTA